MNNFRAIKCQLLIQYSYLNSKEIILLKIFQSSFIDKIMKMALKYSRKNRNIWWWLSLYLVIFVKSILHLRDVFIVVEVAWLERLTKLD